ncbi:hypothetical protein [Mumia sp. Pv 4-285]|uniref:hypothetical protein n=1 Tax=Mumia qirimensis TaxID=3234852 RepID=UPI00351CC36E
MSGTRWGVGVGGVAAAAYGAWLLLRLDLGQLVSAVLWLGGGVLAHDAVLAPLVVLVSLLLVRLLPQPARLPAALVGLVWGTVTVMALPVLSGQGGGDENATLLDRSYGTAWMCLTAGAAAVVLVWSGVRARRGRRAGT